MTNSIKIENTCRQAIRTKYLGPTNTRGARIKAYAWAGSVTVEFDYSLNEEQRHAKAAIALMDKVNWDYKRLACGGCDKAEGYFFIILD